ncbi:octapeptide-repeat protein T2-like [Corythoichthys intestinalis]|uniref:octapeptide-repeat protein T2-like n=1 Tax=Corythoichthys intestinalis TaxID=161448 RepID=UPI0025A5D194|nr:octapeptide-repeat protein T2-like [Corythoichthys intestinalis]XP_061802749.1 octapeptide-repeat protein T2-like [Nerophis lumbriciformis]
MQETSDRSRQAEHRSGASHDPRREPHAHTGRALHGALTTAEGRGRERHLHSKRSQASEMANPRRRSQEVTGLDETPRKPAEGRRRERDLHSKRGQASEIASPRHRSQEATGHDETPRKQAERRRRERDLHSKRRQASEIANPRHRSQEATGHDETPRSKLREGDENATCTASAARLAR